MSDEEAAALPPQGVGPIRPPAPSRDERVAAAIARVAGTRAAAGTRDEGQEGGEPGQESVATVTHLRRDGPP